MTINICATTRILVFGSPEKRLSYFTSHSKELFFNLKFITIDSIENSIHSVRMESPEIILIDVLSSGIDAFQLCKCLKTDPSTCSISVILLVDQNVETGDYSMGLESGADLFLKKPVNCFELQAQIKLLKKRHTRDINPEKEIGHDNMEQSVREKLSQSENCYQTLFADASDGICIHDFTGRIYEANRSAYSVLGYRKDEFLKLSIFDTINPECARLTIERLKILREQKHCIFENTMVAKDGSLLPVEISSRVVNLEGREIIISIGRDISKRKVAEKNLRESEERFTKVFRSNTVLIAITTLDDDNIIDCNDAFLEATGYDSCELLCRNFVELGVFPDSTQRHELIRKIKEKGFLKKADIIVRTKTGDIRHCSLSMDIIRLDGRECIVNVMLDITDKKHMEVALRESEAELRLTLDATTEGIWKWDLARNLISYSPSYYSMLGYEPFEFPQTLESWKSLLHPEDRQRLQEGLDTFFETDRHAKDRCEMEYRLKTKCGDYKWIRSMATVVERDRDSRAIRIIGIHEDITFRKQMQLELIEAKKDAEEASRFKSVLLSNMNHEFRTPLNGILGITGILEGEVENPALRELISLIRISGQRLHDTLESFMKMAQLVAGKLNITMRPVLCSFVVKRVIVNLGDQAAEKKLPLFLDLRQDSVIMADDKILQDILHYLVTNALKFTKAGEIRIIVDTDERDGHARALIHVKDTGIGIPTEYYEQILQEFRQLSEGVSRCFEGMGLGLSLAKKMTELMKGTFTFVSKLNQGSMFTISFPVHTEKV
jgi:PAS domain S-box-containing protein